MRHPIRAQILAVPISIVMPALALAQTGDGTMMLPTDINVHDVGWAQIFDFTEIGEFFLAVVETLTLVAVFAFHPKANALRKYSEGWLVQASMFLFGLIGMLVGFLVVHHGYLIGFVIFGLGSLFRFRMASSSLLDGAILIMVTLIGLSVGLNLPVMAVIAAAAGFATLWFVTARKSTVVELKFADDDARRAALDPVRAAFEQRGFKVVGTRKADFKPVVELILSHKDDAAASLVPSVLDDLAQAGHGAKDWYVD